MSHNTAFSIQLRLLAAATLVAALGLMFGQATGVQAAVCNPQVAVPIKAILGGAYNTSNSLMTDALSTNNLMPLTEPYTAMGYVMQGGSGNTTVIPSIAGNQSPVDWVVIELRSAINPAEIVATDTVTLGRDGIANQNAHFAVPEGNYYVAIEHRNHMPLMTATAIPVSLTTPLVDFSDLNVPMYDPTPGGSGTRITLNTIGAMRPGDVVYTPGGTRQIDIDDVNYFVNNQTIVSSVYSNYDVNMDGIYRTSGAAAVNDYSRLLNLGMSSDPQAVFTATTPTGMLGAAQSCDVAAITSTFIPAPSLAVPYAFTPASIGTGPVTFAVSAGALPPGLTLSTATGLISGSATTEGFYTFTITAQNLYGSGSQSFSTNVAAVAALSPGSGQSTTAQGSSQLAYSGVDTAAAAMAVVAGGALMASGAGLFGFSFWWARKPHSPGRESV